MHAYVKLVGLGRQRTCKVEGSVNLSKSGKSLIYKSETMWSDLLTFNQTSFLEFDSREGTFIFEQDIQIKCCMYIFFSTHRWLSWMHRPTGDLGVVGWCEGAVYLTSPGRPTDIGLQLGKACYPCSG